MSQNTFTIKSDFVAQQQQHGAGMVSNHRMSHFLRRSLGDAQRNTLHTETVQSISMVLEG